MVKRYSDDGKRPKSFYELDLSDEHMAQVARFLHLGDFDRQRWLKMRGFIAWMKSRYGGRFNNVVGVRRAERPDPKEPPNDVGS